MHKLHDGESAKAIEKWLTSELRDHFGMTPDRQRESDFACELVGWWTTATTQ
jgi:hypothetical protein